MTGTVTDVKAYQWYAGGQWRDVTDGKLFDDFEPYTGNLYAQVADCGAEEARLAISAAHEAFGAWAELPASEKARLFLKSAEVVRRRRPEIAQILARETGSTIPFSTFRQELVASTLEQAANWVYLPKGLVLQSNVADTHSIGVITSSTEVTTLPAPRHRHPWPCRTTEQPRTFRHRTRSSTARRSSVVAAEADHPPRLAADAAPNAR
jgi:hypothetical protein